MKMGLLIGFAFILFCCFVTQAVGNDTIILSNNHEINKYLTQPVTLPIVVDAQMVSPTVEEYRIHNIKEHVIDNVQIPTLEFDLGVIANFFRSREKCSLNIHACNWANVDVIPISISSRALVGYDNYYNTILGTESIGVTGMDYKHGLVDYIIPSGVFGSKYNIKWLGLNITQDEGIFSYDFDSWFAPDIILGKNRVFTDFWWLLDGVLNTLFNLNNPSMGPPVTPIYLPK